MKIFSSFDTHFKRDKLLFYRKKYGQENVLLISRGPFFFLTKVFFPLFLSLGFVSILSLFVLYELGEEYYLTSLPFLIILFILANIPIFKHLVDYTMDFCIVTPEEVVLIRQEGLLNRTDVTMETSKIKSIYVNKHYLRDSIFNEGIIDFMGEGDERSGEISFDHVYDPEKVKDKIQVIIMSPHHG